MPDILRMLSQAEQLDFSQNFLIPRPNYIGDTIFPDRKTQNFKAEYLRLAAGSQLPTMALVHGLDTEAHIGSRPALERVTVEKLFIKEKINQTESLRQVLENGAFNDSALIDFVYDDWGRLAEGVRCRTEVAKMEVLSTGKMTIKENGLNFSVDFGVPNGNTGFDIDVSTPDKNVLTQIEEIVETARDKGFTISGMVLSGSVLSKMLTNEGISKAIYGARAAHGLSYAARRSVQRALWHYRDSYERPALQRRGQRRQADDPALLGQEQGLLPGFLQRPAELWRRPVGRDS